MNATEHIIACLSEECAEVAKECGKALRFGLTDQVTMDPNGPRGTTGPTNADKIHAEMIDLIAVYLMAAKSGMLPRIGISIRDDETMAAVLKKQAKVGSYMDYAARVGSLENS
jgi:hypothetical protein